MISFHVLDFAPIWLHVKVCNQIGTVSPPINLRYRLGMSNGIRHFREKKGISKAELARRVGVTRQHLGRMEEDERKLSAKWAEKIAPYLDCTPQELLFPELAQIDLAKFNSVFEILKGNEPRPESPALAIDTNFLERMVPDVSAHNLRFMMVDAYQANGLVTKGDALVIDTDDKQPNRPGLYALDIAGVVQWRYLSPMTSGTVQVHSDTSAANNETVNPTDLKVVGRARLRISTL
ncbi:helix-turn-helix domain-containing protein [Mesorhizobium sp. M7A.F.Ca.MR.228.00.0.0]|nr:helix-turn-helix domain-containing protein [Mesorhizobium sp. M7A.F.Ca.MR.245.00.0.0]RUV51495.1 helix-turn-helix domain-containing protein [Mesorhizobium sp. M7A.F.Ca.MR.228.00.0.0]